MLKLLQVLILHAWYIWQSTAFCFQDEKSLRNSSFYPLIRNPEPLIKDWFSVTEPHPLSPFSGHQLSVPLKVAMPKLLQANTSNGLSNHADSHSNLSSSFHLSRGPGRLWNEIQQLKETSCKYRKVRSSEPLLSCVLKDWFVIPKRGGGMKILSSTK